MRGPRWVRIKKKIEVENLVTHNLYNVERGRLEEGGGGKVWRGGGRRGRWHDEGRGGGRGGGMMGRLHVPEPWLTPLPQEYILYSI